MQAYHIKTENLRKEIISDNALCVHCNAYKFIWQKSSLQINSCPYEQTKKSFAELSTVLKDYNANIFDNLFRTWIYVHDVDNNYQSMVKARGVSFDCFGLNNNTHYVASTGIGGQGEDNKNLVHVVSLSILGLDAEQVEYLTVPEFMDQPCEYGVAFERGTRLIFGDRSHYHISGTASINNKGQVLFLDDVERQTIRAVNNIRALLKRYDADLDNLKLATVYLRNMTDAPLVESILESILPANLSYTMVCGSVCRSSWLVEIDAIAISSQHNKRFPDF